MKPKDQIIAKWVEFKGGVRNLWGRIPLEELETTKGDIGLIKQLASKYYNESFDTITTKMNKLLNSFDNDSDRSAIDTAQSSYNRRPIEVNKRTSEPAVKARSKSITVDESINQKYKYINDTAIKGASAPKYNSNQHNPHLDDASPTDIDELKSH